MVHEEREHVLALFQGTVNLRIVLPRRVSLSLCVVNPLSGADSEAISGAWSISKAPRFTFWITGVTLPFELLAIIPII